MRSDPLLQSALAPYHQTLSLVVHAGAKVGKTTLAATAPLPLLLLDAEGGTKFLPLRKVYWDPMTGPPPLWDGAWDACVVHVRQYEDMSYAYQYLVMGMHSFASISVDSITQVQRRCKKTIDEFGGRNTQAAWGMLLDKMLELISGFRDLTLHPTNPVSVVTFVTETINKDGKWRPFMQGQMGNTLPYVVDLLGYLHVVDLLDPQQPLAVVKQRQLLIGPDATIEAGERVQGRLGHSVVEPNLTQMLYQVYQTPTQQPQAAAYQAQGGYQ